MTVREIMGNKRMRRNHDAISVISWITIALLIEVRVAEARSFIEPGMTTE